MACNKGKVYAMTYPKSCIEQLFVARKKKAQKSNEFVLRYIFDIYKVFALDVTINVSCKNTNKCAKK